VKIPAVYHTTNKWRTHSPHAITYRPDRCHKKCQKIYALRWSAEPIFFSLCACSSQFCKDASFFSSQPQIPGCRLVFH
jgi:hypothetical protein